MKDEMKYFVERWQHFFILPAPLHWHYQFFLKTHPSVEAFIARLDNATRNIHENSKKEPKLIAKVSKSSERNIGP